MHATYACSIRFSRLPLKSHYIHPLVEKLQSDFTVGKIPDISHFNRSGVYSSYNGEVVVMNGAAGFMIKTKTESTFYLASSYITAKSSLTILNKVHV